MRVARLKAQLGEVWEVPRDLLLRRYPAFVTGGELPREHVPVFCFHSLEPESFGRKLEHLARNGYVTLSADEYFEVLARSRPAPERAVVLTFDDGRSSVRTIGLPLMQRHGFKGIVFVVPGRTLDSPGPLPPTLADVRPGGATLRQILDREHGPDAFMTWQELQDLSRSGLFDVQSHSLSHARVHVAPQVVGFMNPAFERGYGPLDAPLVRVDGEDRLAPAIPLGTPLLRSEPRLSEALRFHEHPGLSRDCLAAVEQGGGRRFFERPDWERVLRARVRARAVDGGLETPAEREAAIRRELVEAQRAIAERLGRPALDLCYPWHVAGPTARRVAREAGYRSAYCGKLAGVPVTLPGGDPLGIARVGEDYVELLPGRGRGRLTEILKAKVGRRFGAGRVS